MLAYKRIPFDVRELKADNGKMEFSGLASTFGNLDHSGDVVMRGAFDATLQSGTKRRLLWQHDMSEPIGVEQKLETTDTGLFGTWKLSRTTRGLDAWELLKDGAVDSLSIGYIPDEVEFDDAGVRLLKSVTLLEVSLVSIPANDMAVVTQLKSLLAAGLLSPDDLDLKAAIARHKTDTSEGPWDGPAAQAALPNSAGAATYRKAAAWVDPDKDPNTKAAYRFWHHEVSADGKVGPANLTACSSGIGVLNGGRGGTTIPDADKRGVYNHLAGHLKDAGKEPPALKASGKTIDIDVPFDALLEQLADGITYGADEAQALWTRRADEGREPKAAHLDAVRQMLAAAEATSEKLRALLPQDSAAEAKDTGSVDPPVGLSDVSLRLANARHRLVLAGILEHHA